MQREVRWERMFPDQLEAAFVECPLAYFPYGLCEPHGPQNAVGLDGLKVHAIACEAARAHGGIVAPLDMWHIHEVGGYAVWSHGAVGQVERCWLTAMPPWQHFRNVCYHVRQADALGFKAAIFLTGHYGPNWEDLKRLLELLQPHVGTRLFGLPDFEANTPGFDNNGKSGGDHAGKVETSLLWALMPECTDVSRIPEDVNSAEHFAMGKNARESDRQVGERMVADEVAYLHARAEELFASYESTQPAHALRTFDDVERVWEEVVRPAFGEFRTMQAIWRDGQPELPEDSCWHENSGISDRW
ncbi:MAG TPA: creatininase family protein [Armatimonadota bacterium]|nr:creatininase family protein [Armatimonadota bacterium]